MVTKRKIKLQVGLMDHSCHSCNKGVEEKGLEKLGLRHWKDY